MKISYLYSAARLIVYTRFLLAMTLKRRTIWEPDILQPTTIICFNWFEPRLVRNNERVRINSYRFVTISKCPILLFTVWFSIDMGGKEDATEEEKRRIIALASKGISVTEISRKLKRSRPLIYKVLRDPFHKRKRSDKGKVRCITPHQMSCLKRASSRMPMATSKAIFQDAGIENVPRSTRNVLLNKIARVTKPAKTPPITKKHKRKRIEWAKANMKTNFSHVIFTDECRATLDGPDGWSKGWLREGVPLPTRIRRQQGGGGVMFWAGIVGETLVGPFKVPEGVKITSDAYINFLTKNFIPWYKKQPLQFKRKAILMHDGAPSHSAKKTVAFLEKNGFKDSRLMKWPSVSPDLNPIENLWAMIKRRLYVGGRQFTTKNELWEEIQTVSKSITSEEIINLVSSVDNRLIKVLQKSGSHIGY